MDAIKLVDRHLVFFELEVGNTLLQTAYQQVVGKLILIGETRSRDGLKPRKKSLVDFLAMNDGCKREVSKLVVVTVVAKISGPLRELTDIGLVLFVKKSVLRREALGNWSQSFVFILRKDEDG